jgi:DNA-binding PucR family transcriptional regulator
VDRWQPIIELIDLVTSDPTVIDEAVRDVQVGVVEIGRLAPEDVRRHTRALLAAAVRAIAERRGPSDAELDFIADLAVARARQQVPIQAVLTAVHVASRPVWQRARALAEEREVPLSLLVDARDLYDEWAEQVRARLIVAHRDAELSRTQSLHDRRAALLQRALEGGAAAALAVAEAGLPAAGPLWVVHSEPSDDAAAGQLEERLRTDVQDLFGRVDDALVGVLGRQPRARVEEVVGLAGPFGPDELDVAALWARWAHGGADARGRRGVVALDEVGVEAAMVSRPALGHALAARRLEPLLAEGDFADAVARTVIAYAEHDRRVDATAASLFVHPNTVRHRLRRFGDLTGLELDSTFGTVAAWWAARSWMARP